MNVYLLQRLPDSEGPEPCKSCHTMTRSVWLTGAWGLTFGLKGYKTVAGRAVLCSDCSASAEKPDGK